MDETQSYDVVVLGLLLAVSGVLVAIAAGIVEGFPTGLTTTSVPQRFSQAVTGYGRRFADWIAAAEDEEHTGPPAQ